MDDSPQITPKVLVTTDFSPASERAFYHALAIAARMRARLTLLHTGPESRRAVPWDRFPGVRDTLAAWGLLAADAPRTAVAQQLGVEVTKMAIRDDSPRLGITDYLRRHPTDLLVMATEGRAGLRRLFHPSIADSVSYLTRSHTLMLPYAAAGLIDPATGLSRLRRVLCALDPERDPRAALAYLKQWLPALAGGAAFEVACLESAEAPLPLHAMRGPSGDRAWHTLPCTTHSTDTIIDAARDFGADLVVAHARKMLSPWARIRGNRNDRIMRELGLPLLCMPLLRD